MGRARKWFCASVDCTVCLNTHSGSACWFASIAFICVFMTSKTVASARGSVKLR